MPRKKDVVDDDSSYHSTERNFITSVRAMNEFLLKPSDLIGLRQTKRRSPHENEPPLTVYWRKDVESKYVIIYYIFNIIYRLNQFYISFFVLYFFTIVLLEFQGFTSLWIC